MIQQSISGKYEYLTHPADLKICATGDSLEVALDNLIQAVTATRDDATLIKTNKLMHKTLQIKIHITSRRLTSIIYDLCQHYLELLEVKKQLPLSLTNAKIKSLKTGFTLTGTFECAQLTDEQVENKIKAPTYHEMNISSVGDKTLVTVVLDI